MKKLSLTNYCIPILLICACNLPYTSFANNVIREKGIENSGAEVKVAISPDFRMITIEVVVEKPSPMEILLRDGQNRSIYIHTRYYPGPGLYRHVWHPTFQIKGMVMFESTHDGSRRQTGPVVITPP